MAINGRTYTNLAAAVIGKLNDYIDEHELEEDVISTLLRLLGFTNTFEETDDKKTFVTSFARKKDKGTLSAKKQFKDYLEGLKKRIERWERDSNTARINKIKRLIGEEEETPDPGITEEDSLDVAVQKVRKFQKQVSEDQDELGLLRTQSALYDAASDKVDTLVAVLPTNEFGNFGPEIISMLKADSGYLTETSLRLRRRINALEVELNKLERQEKYIITGISLEKVEAGKISLRVITEIMLYLLNKIEYKCSECLYLSGNLCLYGGNNLDTVPGNSCQQVYNKDDNPFWRPSNAIIDNVKKFAERL